MTVRDLMTPYPKTLGPSDTIQVAARIMRDGGFSSVPIIDQLGSVVGIVADRDIAVNGVAVGHGPGTPIREVMTQMPESVGIDTTIEQALIVMSASGVRRLLVIENSHLAGILTLGDIATRTVPNADKPDDFREPSDYPDTSQAAGLLSE